MLLFQQEVCVLYELNINYAVYIINGYWVCSKNNLNPLFKSPSGATDGRHNRDSSAKPQNDIVIRPVNGENGGFEYIILAIKRVFDLLIKNSI